MKQLITLIALCAILFSLMGCGESKEESWNPYETLHVSAQILDTTDPKERDAFVLEQTELLAVELSNLDSYTALDAEVKAEADSQSDTEDKSENEKKRDEIGKTIYKAYSKRLKLEEKMVLEDFNFTIYISQSSFNMEFRAEIEIEDEGQRITIENLSYDPATDQISFTFVKGKADEAKQFSFSMSKVERSEIIRTATNKKQIKLKGDLKVTSELLDKPQLGVFHISKEVDLLN